MDIKLFDFSVPHDKNNHVIFGEMYLLSYRRSLSLDILLLITNINEQTNWLVDNKKRKI